MYYPCCAACTLNVVPSHTPVSIYRLRIGQDIDHHLQSPGCYARRAWFVARVIFRRFSNLSCKKNFCTFSFFLKTLSNMIFLLFFLLSAALNFHKYFLKSVRRYFLYKMGTTGYTLPYGAFRFGVF